MSDDATPDHSAVQNSGQNTALNTAHNASNKGWPERYFAVIFTAQRTMSEEDMYQIMSDRMVTLAQQQPGFLGLESVRGDDGIGITVSYWVDRASIRNWRVHAEHLVVQQMGRQEFYEWYQIRVAEVVNHRSYEPEIAPDIGLDTEPDMDPDVGLESEQETSLDD